jgi:hypothetical protein
MSWNVIWMMISCFLYSLSLSNVSQVINTINARRQQVDDKVMAITQFSKDTKIDKKLKEKLKNTVAYITSNTLLYKAKIFEELPAGLKAEIAREMFDGVIRKIRFFDDKDSNFIGQIVTLL